MTDEFKKKIRKKVKKLSELIVESSCTKNDILEMMKDDPEFQIARDIIGNVLDYYEWRINPLYPNVRCSTSGEIEISGQRFYPREFSGVLKIIYANKKHISAPMLVLSTFVPMPKDGKYTVRHRNEDFRDLRVSNLYWYKLT